MLNKGLLVVISGPSGSGKDTILKKLLEKNKNAKLSISATTRSKREHEIDGEDYYFMSKTEFIQMISNNAVLEYAEYCGNYYGTPLDTVNYWRDMGKDVILEIEVKGAKQVRERCDDLISIFILPPSLKELKNRLVNRNTEPMDVINDRLEVAKEEIKCAANYDYVVINDKVESCVDDICKILSAEKMRSSRKSKIIEEVLTNENAICWWDAFRKTK